MLESVALADSQDSVGRGQELIGELRRTLGRMEAALGSISDALVITDQDGKVLWCNQPFEQFVQRGRLTILGRSILSLLPGDVNGRPILRGLPTQAAAEGSPGSQQALLAKDPLRAVAIEWRTVVSDPERPLVFCLRDISVDLTHEAMQREVKRIAEERHHLATQVLVCPVTGLPNRRALEQRLAQAIRRLEDQPAQLALYFCDLNGFKQINDCHGHAAGDALLVAVGERLQSCLRQDDLVARLGGDEFVVLSEGPRGGRAAWDLAARLQEALSRPWTIDERTLRPSMSVGIAITDDPALGPEELLRRADLAMYDAKSGSDRHISLHDERLETRVSSRRTLGRRLRRALEEGLLHQEGFGVVFRPLVRLADGVQEGMEAELCFASQEDLPLPLPDLLAVADQAGVMPQLGEWMRNVALEQVQRSRRQGQPCALVSTCAPARCWSPISAPHCSTRSKPGRSIPPI